MSDDPGDGDAVARYEMERYRFYLEERRFIDESKSKAAESYDKYMITLASGALGLSILYVEKVAPRPAAGSVPWLLVAWLGFASALLAMLGSFLGSQAAWGRRLEIHDLDERKRTRGRSAAVLPAWRRKKLEKQNPWDAWTERANYAAIAFFMVGVLTFAVFTYLNLPGEETHAMPVDQARAAGPGDPKPQPRPAPGDGGTRGNPSRPAPPPPPSPRPTSK